MRNMAHGDAATRLAELAKVPSVSCAFKRRTACFTAAEVVASWIEDVGGHVERVSVGFQEVAGERRWDLPPVLLGTVGAANGGSDTATEKAVVLVVGGYDVREVLGGAGVDAGAEVGEFSFANNGDGVLHGVGLAGKGSLAAWIGGIKKLLKSQGELPVVVKFLVEGMSQAGSECMVDLVARETATAAGFLADVDYVIGMSPSRWPKAAVPAVVVGARGVVVLDVQVSGGYRALRGGEYAGAVREPMRDLLGLLDNVLERGLEVPDLGGGLEETEECELVKGDGVDGVAEFYQGAGGVPGMIAADAGTGGAGVIYAARTRLPAVSVHGVVGGYAGTGFGAALPPVVSGKVSVRVGEGGDAMAASKALVAMLETAFKESGSGNDLTVEVYTVEPWAGNVGGALADAVGKAIRAPHVARTGDAQLVLGELSKRLAMPAVMLPLFGPVGVDGGGDGAGVDDDPIFEDELEAAEEIVGGVLREVAALFKEGGGAAEAAVHRKKAAATRQRMDAEAASRLATGAPEDGPVSGPLGRIRQIWAGLA